MDRHLVSVRVTKEDLKVHMGEFLYGEHDGEPICILELPCKCEDDCGGKLCLGFTEEAVAGLLEALESYIVFKDVERKQGSEWAWVPPVDASECFPDDEEEEDDYDDYTEWD